MIALAALCLVLCGLELLTGYRALGLGRPATSHWQFAAVLGLLAFALGVTGASS